MKFFVWIIERMNREKGRINWPINWPNPSNNDIAFFVCKHFLTDKAHYRKIDFLPTFIHTICRINFSIVLVLYILYTIITLMLYLERSHDIVWLLIMNETKNTHYTHEKFCRISQTKKLPSYKKVSKKFFEYKLANHLKPFTPFSL